MSPSGVSALLKWVDSKFRGHVTFEFTIKGVAHNPPISNAPLADKKNRQILVSSSSMTGVQMRMNFPLEFRFNNRINSKNSYDHRNPHEIYAVFEKPPKVTVDSPFLISTPLVSRVSTSGAEIIVFYNYDPHNPLEMSTFMTTAPIDLKICIEGILIPRTLRERAWRLIYSGLTISLLGYALYSLSVTARNDLNSVKALLIVGLGFLMALVLSSRDD